MFALRNSLHRESAVVSAALGAPSVGSCRGPGHQAAWDIVKFFKGDSVLVVYRLWNVQQWA